MRAKEEQKLKKRWAMYRLFASVHPFDPTRNTDETVDAEGGQKKPKGCKKETKRVKNNTEAEQCPKNQPNPFNSMKSIQ